MNNPTFKCPGCGMPLSVEPAKESAQEHSSMGKPIGKKNASSMPVDELKNVIKSQSPSQGY